MVEKLINDIMNSLPEVVTREQLINAYLQKVKIETKNPLIVHSLIYAAGKAGKKVKGRSALEVNIKSTNNLTNKITKYNKTIRFVLEQNKQKIINEYNSGYSSTQLAVQYNCSTSTMHKFLKQNNGDKMRRNGRYKNKDIKNKNMGE